MIPYGHHDITDADVEAVVAIMRSDFLTQGPMVGRFEAAVAAYCGACHAVAVNSATSALHLSCLALGLGPGDWLWTSPISFVASANCGIYCGAKVDFVDIDPRSYTLCPRALERKLAMAEQEGRLPKIVVPVHLCGQPCDMAAIHDLALQYGFRILEDASHAIGGRYRGAPVGACAHSDVAVFSFHPVKIITTAEGGMALTNDRRLAERIALLRSHGVTRDPALMTRPPDGPWSYEQVDLGFNYRMTEVQAALGLSQMSRVDAYVTRRHVLAERYDAELADLPLALPWRDADSLSALHLYVVRLGEQTGCSRAELFARLRAAGIGVNVHYIPIHLQPYYRAMGFRPGAFPEAERYYEQAITLPLYPTLSEVEQDQVVAEISEGAVLMRLAVIPARGGSKRIPRKNIRLFNGKPMIAWSIAAAWNSGCFDVVAVSTDDREIAAVAQQYGAKVPFSRPSELADDHVGTLPVMRHAVDWYSQTATAPTSVCCIYATAPLIEPADIRRGLDVFTATESDYTFSATSFPSPIQRAFRLNRDSHIEMFHPELFDVRSQDLEPALHDAAQFYWGRASAWLRQERVFGPAATVVVLPRFRVQDIDTEEDWEMAEHLARALASARSWPAGGQQ